MFTLNGRDDIGIFSPLSDSSSADIISGASALGSGSKSGGSYLSRHHNGGLSSQKETSATLGEQLSRGLSSFKDAKPPRPQPCADGKDVIRLKNLFESRTSGRTKVFSPLIDNGSSPVTTLTRTPATNFSSKESISTVGHSNGCARRSSDTPASRFATPNFRLDIAGDNRVPEPSVNRPTNGIHDRMRSSYSSHEVVMANKEAQTGPDNTGSHTRPNHATAQGVQAEFIRSVVDDCLEVFEQRWRDNFNSLYAKLLFQLMELEGRLERTIGNERLDYTRRLTDENERLRAENERLKALQFGKFTGPS